MSNRKNGQWRLKTRPTGMVREDNFEYVEEPVPDLGANEFLVRNVYLAFEPAMRGWLNDVKSYVPPVQIGEVMRASTVGRVVESNNAGYAEGTWVTGMFGWQEYAVSDGKNVWFKHDPALAPLSTALGILGINGITAYFALLEVGRPKAGETVAVSTAAGAVGSAVGQIAKIKGCRTVGITSSAEKIALCREVYGYDEAISYRGDLEAGLAAACPKGVDVYFDNTSGSISDAVYRHLAVGARAVVCGTASVASWEPWPQGPRVERHILVKRATMQGFLLFDYAARFGEARAQLAAWLAEGRLEYREEVLEGLEQAPGAIAHLYAGGNLGKLVIRV